MLLLATLCFLQGAGWAGSMPGGAGAPGNITIMFLSPTSVRVSWGISVDNVDKYDVTYKPTDASAPDECFSYKVVAVVAGNSEVVTLNNLLADTQYQVTVTAVRGGKKFRSGPIVFRTMEPPRSSPQQDAGSVTLGPPVVPVSSHSEHGEPPSPTDSQQYVQVRGVEVGIVLLVLVVWVAAIALFFNRWGKIRMLLPYQPDYKEQLKVPGTGACAVASGGSCAGQQHGAGPSCPQHHHWLSHQHLDFDKWPRSVMRPLSRPRINSAIYISSAQSADSEFVHTRPFRSELCRRAHSAENIPLSGMHQTRRLSGVPMLSVSGPPPSDSQGAQHI